MIDVRDIHSVTDFQRNTRKHLARLRKTKAPMVLTVNGSASVVVQDAATYQELVNRIDALEEEKHFIAAINEGLRDIEEGRVYPLEELKRRHGNAVQS